MSVKASNLKKFPFLSPESHPIVCWFILIIFQLQRTSIENARIDTIDTLDTIDRINCNIKYKDNRYDWSYKLTLQTSPNQWHHCCFLFRFAWFIMVRSIVVLQSVIILVARSPLICILILFVAQSYSSNHSIGETALPTRNGSLLCVSRSASSS